MKCLACRCGKNVKCYVTPIAIVATSVVSVTYMILCNYHILFVGAVFSSVYVLVGLLVQFFCVRDAHANERQPLL